MELKQSVRLDVKKDEISFCEPVQDKIVINDAYNGILILNDSFSLIADIPLLPGTLRVRRVYKKVTEEALLFYCYESKVLVYLDMHSLEHTIIPLLDDYKGQTFTPLYYWSHNAIILATDNKLYKVSILDKKISRLHETEIEGEHLEFYKLWSDYKSADVLFYDPSDYTLIFRQKDTLVFEHFDMMRGRRVHKELGAANGIKDVVYHKNRVALLQDKLLEVRDLGSKMSVEVKVQPPSIFTVVRFIPQSYKKLVAVWRDNTDVKHDLLKLYEIVD